MDYPKRQNQTAEEKKSLIPFKKTQWQFLLLLMVFLAGTTVLVAKEWMLAQQAVTISAIVPDTSTPPSPSPSPEPMGSGGGGGGSGGGGSGGYFEITTMVTVSGRAYPMSKVTLLKDGKKAVSTIAGPDARFEISLTNLAKGEYSLGIYSEDKEGRRSSLFTFPVSVTKGAVTKVSGIFLAPTIAVDKKEITPGDTLTFFGQSVPQGVVTILVNSEKERFLKTETDEKGIYLVQWDTSLLEFGKHTAQSKTTFKKEISPLSLPVEFQVTSKYEPEPEPELKPAAPSTQSDVNQDDRVNLVDFSIMAYWYKRPSPPAELDLNEDKKIDLVDFSIMAYYWTG